MRRITRACAIVATAATTAAMLVGVSAGVAAADPSASAWQKLRQCESSGRYDINTGNGYYGAYQFNLGTWKSVGGTGYPNEASKAEQDYRALLLYRMRGWQPWSCATIMGLAEDGDAKSGVKPPKPASLSGSASNGSASSSSATSTSSNTTTPNTSSSQTSAPAWPGRQYFQGDYSETLKTWQKQAGALGYGLVGTGYFGPKTEKAVLDIQRRAGLNVVGFIGPKTWAAAWTLDATSTAEPSSTTRESSPAQSPAAPARSAKPPTTSAPATPPATSASATCPIGATTAPPWPGEQFRYGQSGDVLQCWQKQMGSRGYPLVGTGYYGDMTKASALDLQRRNHINDSGIIGPLTWQAAWEGTVK